MSKVSLRVLLRRAWRERIADWRGYARSLTRKDADAEDLIGEAVTDTLRADPSLASVDEIHRYLITAIRNTFFKWNRVRRRRAEIVAELRRRPEELTSTLLEDLIEAEHRGHLEEAVGSALQKMPREIREAIGLYLIEAPGLTIQKIAEIQGVSSSTAHRRVQQALSVMGEELEEFDR